MENFATYEKSIESTVVTITHTVRILLNSDRLSIEETLKNVPYSAKVSMITDDTDAKGLNGYGEIIFTEEQ